MTDVLFEQVGRLGLVTLNRPAQLNALTHEMALRIEERLLHWRDEPAVAAVMIIGAGPRAFCAGGDVRAVWAEGHADPVRLGPRNWQFYADEYRLNTLIKRFPKPYVALMDGVVMGGGVGLSLHGSRRIAGDATLFAMPETAIGLFPDVGATFFLPRLPGEVGLWLGLTGARLKAADCVAAGLCDLYAPSAREGALIAGLGEADFAGDAAAAVDAVLDRFRADPGPASLPALRPVIDRCFGGDSVEAVLAALDAEPGDWAAEQAAGLRKKSPTSLRLAFRALRQGAAMAFEDCMRMEYQLARFCMTHPDFYEGVRAVIIDKDHAPRWRPATLAEADAASVAAAFEPLPPGEALALGR